MTLHDAWLGIWLLIWLPPLVATLALDPFAYIVPGGYTLSSYVKHFLHLRRPATRLAIIALWVLGFGALTLHFAGQLG